MTENTTPYVPPWPECCDQAENWIPNSGECSKCGSHCMPRHLWPKPMTLAENVKDAQKTVSSWTPEKRATVQLEGESLNKPKD